MFRNTISERQLKKIIFILSAIAGVIFTLIFFIFLNSIEPREMPTVDNVKGKMDPKAYLKDVSESIDKK